MRGLALDKLPPTPYPGDEEEDQELTGKHMTKAENELCQLAERTVAQILDAGRKQGHAPDDFQQDPDYHLDRAIRHAMTYRLMRDSNQLEDAEGHRGHLERAVTRLVMALSRHGIFTLLAVYFYAKVLCVV